MVTMQPLALEHLGDAKRLCTDELEDTFDGSFADKLRVGQTLSAVVDGQLAGVCLYDSIKNLEAVKHELSISLKVRRQKPEFLHSYLEQLAEVTPGPPFIESHNLSSGKIAITDDDVYIQAVVVDPAMRGRSISTLLFSEVEQDARENTLFLQSRDKGLNRKRYEHQGFVALYTWGPTYTGGVGTTLLMKRLS